MSKVPSRGARLAHAAKYADLWNAGNKPEWVASWRTICPDEVRTFDPVGPEEKHGFAATTSDAFDMFQSILKINMITVQVNGNEIPSRTFKWLTASRHSRGTTTATC